MSGERLAAAEDPIADFYFNPAPWMDDALCAQTDPELFFPQKGGSTREARAVCASCPVAAECFDHALEHKERFGIWGGVTERTRRKIERAAARTGSTDITDDLDDTDLESA